MGDGVYGGYRLLGVTAPQPKRFSGYEVNMRKPYVCWGDVRMEGWVVHRHVPEATRGYPSPRTSLSRGSKGAVAVCPTAPWTGPFEGKSDGMARSHEGGLAPAGASPRLRSLRLDAGRCMLLCVSMRCFVL